VKNTQQDMRIGANSKKLHLMLREKIQTQIKEIYENPSELIALNKGIQEAKDRLRIRFLGTLQTKNFIDENITSAEQWDAQEEQLKAKLAMRNERAEEARLRKEEIDLETLKRKVFLVHKWEIIRDKVSSRESDFGNRNGGTKSK
jgi:hypothetical protein